MTVCTGSSRTGRVFNAAEMGFSSGRPKFEWGEKLSTSGLYNEYAKPLKFTMFTSFSPCHRCCVTATALRINAHAHSLNPTQPSHSGRNYKLYLMKTEGEVQNTGNRVGM